MFLKLVAILLAQLILAVASSFYPLNVDLSELNIHQGTQFVVEIVDGNTWASPLSAGIAATLVDSFLANDISSTSFSAMKHAILSTDSFNLISATQLQVDFHSCESYDVDVVEELNFTIPAVSLTNGMASQGTVHIQIFPSRSNLTTQLLMISEGLVRNGGTMITLKLSAGESWTNYSAITLTGNASKPQWDLYSSQLANATKSIRIQSKDTLQIELMPASNFDASEPEAITVHIPADSVASNLKPFHQTYEVLVVTLIPGEFFLQSPRDVPESSICRNSSTLDVSFVLEVGEKWSPDLNASTIKSSLVSDRAGSKSFTAASSELILLSPTIDLDGQRLTIHINGSSAYDASELEMISLSPQPELVESGLLPILKYGAFSDFVVTPSPAMIDSVFFEVTEASIIYGYANVTVTFLGCETFYGGADRASQYLDALAGSGIEPGSFNNTKSTIVNDLSFSFANLFSSLALALGPSADYQISEDENISLTLSGNLTSSGLAPLNATVRVLVHPSRGQLSVRHSGKTKPFSFSEKEFIDGTAGTFELEWDRLEQWTPNAVDVFSVVNFTALIDGNDVPSHSWQGRRDFLLPNLNFSSDRHVLFLPFAADPLYDITRQEVVRASIQSTAIASELLSVDGTTYFDIRVQVSAGAVERVCCGTYRESQIKEGTQMLLRLGPGETWLPTYESLWREAFVSSELLGAESRGWNAQRLSILKTTSFLIQNSGREMNVTFFPSAAYQLQFYEEVVVLHLAPPSLPESIVASSLALQPSSLSFRILRNPSIVNLTLQGASDERNLRSGHFSISLLLTNDKWNAANIVDLFSSFTGSLNCTTCFNSSRTLFLSNPSQATISTSGSILHIQFASVPTYDIASSEEIRIDVPRSLVASGAALRPLFFTVHPSRGLLRRSVDACYTFEENTVRKNGFEVVFSLYDGEGWIDANATDFPKEMFLERAVFSGRILSPSGWMLLRNASEYVHFVSLNESSLLMQVLPMPKFDVSDTENVTIFPVPGLTKSGLPPFGQVCLLFHRTSPKLEQSTFSISEKSLVSHPGPTVLLRLEGEVFVVTSGARDSCIESIAQNISAEGSRPAYISSIFTKESSFSFSAHDPRALLLSLQPLPFFTAQPGTTFVFWIPQKCLLSRQKIALAVNILVTKSSYNLTISPQELEESSLLAGTSIDVFLSYHAEFSRRNLRKLSEFFVTNETIGLGNNVEALLPSWTWQESCARSEEELIGSFCLISPFHVRIHFPRDPRIDISAPIRLSFLTSAPFHLVNSTIPPLYSRFLMIYPSAGTVIAPGAIEYLTYFVNGYSPEANRLQPFNITLAPGETFIDTPENRNLIVASFVTNLSLPTLQNFLVPTNWDLLDEGRTYRVYPTPFAFFSSNVELVKLFVPALVAASGITPDQASNVTLIPDDPPQVLLSPIVLNEAMFWSGPVSVTLLLHGPWPQRYPYNETWVSASGVVLSPWNVSAVPPTGLAARHVLLSSKVEENRLNLTFDGDMFLDIFENETVQFEIPATALLSKVLPSSPVTLVVTPSAGMVALLEVDGSFTATELVVSNLDLPPLQLFFMLQGETFKQSNQTLQMLRESCVSSQGKFSKLLNNSTSPLEISFEGNAVVSVKIHKDSSYDLADAFENISCGVNGSMVESGIAPTVVSQMHFSLTRVEGSLSLEWMEISEQSLRTGIKNVTVKLSAAERWKLPEALSLATVSTGFECLGDKACTKSIQGGLLKAVHRVSFNEMMLSIGNLATFDIYSNATIILCFPPSTVVSGAPLNCSSASFLVFSEGGRLSVNPSRVGVADMRKGRVLLTLTLHSDKWLADAPSRLEIYSSRSDFLNGFESNKDNIFDPAAVGLKDNHSVMFVQFLAEETYSIPEPEELSFYCLSCTTSGHDPFGAAAVLLISRVSVFYNSSSFPTREDIRDGGFVLTFAARNGLFVTWGNQSAERDAYRQTLLYNAYCSDPDPYGLGLQDIVPSILYDAHLHIHRSKISIVLRAAPHYNPCSAVEHLSVPFSSSLFEGEDEPEDKVLTVPVQSYPARVVLVTSLSHNATSIYVSEEVMRTTGLQFNISVEWGVLTLTEGEVPSLFRGQQNCDSCFNSLKSMIMPFGSFGIDNSVLYVNWLPMQQFDVSVNDTVFIDFEPSNFECYAAPTRRLAIHITGQRPRLDAVHVFQREVHPSTAVHVVATGEELSLYDQVSFVPNGTSCDYPDSPLVSYFFPSAISQRRTANFTVSVNYIGVFAVCYRFANIGRAFQATSATLLSTAVIETFDGFSGAVVPNATFTFRFKGDGLNSRPGGDEVGLLNIPFAHKNATCNTPSFFTFLSHDLDGDTLSSQLSSLTTEFLSVAGDFIWCYRLAGTHTFKNIGNFSLDPTITALYPPVLTPYVNQTVNVQAVGFGLDTNPRSEKGNSFFVTNDSTCFNMSSNSIVISSNDTSPGDIRNSTTLLFVLPAMLSPQTLFLCLGRHPTYEFVLQQRELFVLGGVELIASLTPSDRYYQNAGEVVTATCVGLGLERADSFPTFFAIPSSFNCSDLVVNQPPPKWSSTGTSTIVSDSTVLAKFIFERMGAYRVCYTSRERAVLGFMEVPSQKGDPIYIAPAIIDFFPRQADAERSFSITIYGTGFAEENITVFIVYTGTVCKPPNALFPPFIPLKINSTTELRLPSFSTNIAGSYSLCVMAALIDDILEEGPLVVASTIQVNTTKFFVEQYDEVEHTIHGAGLSVHDAIYQAQDCQLEGVPLSVVIDEETGKGLRKLRVVLSTVSVESNLRLCVQSNTSTSIVTAAFFDVIPLVPRPVGVSIIPDHVDKPLMVVVHGKGLNTSGDRIYLFNDPCPADLPALEQNNWVKIDQLSPAGKAFLHRVEGSFYQNFSAIDYKEVHVCYYLFATNSTTEAGSFHLPFENRPPFFLLRSPTLITYSTAVPVIVNVSLVNNLDTGSDNEVGQEVFFVVRSMNVSDIFFATPRIFSDGNLELSLLPKAEKAVRFTFYAEDNGGTDFGGRNRTDDATVDIVVIRATNTPPTFSFSAPYVNISTSAVPRTLTVPSFLINIAPGEEGMFEQNQSVHFTLTVTAGQEYISSVSITDDGTLQISLPDTVAELHANAKAIVRVVAKDNGGTADYGARDTSLPADFLINIIVINHQPSFTLKENLVWAFGGDPYNRKIIASSSIGAGDVGQTISYTVSVIPIGTDWPLANFFLKEPSIAEDGTLSFHTLKTAKGEFIATVTMWDSGGSAMGGVDRTPPQNVTLLIVGPYELQLSPSTGVSLQTAFDIVLKGGFDIFNNMGLKVSFHLSLAPNASTFSANSSVVMLRRSPYTTYRTNYLPWGTVTLWAEVFNFEDKAVAFPHVTFQVLEPTNIDLSNLADKITADIPLDPMGAAVGTYCLSLLVSLYHTPAAPRMKGLDLLAQGLQQRKLRISEVEPWEVLLAARTLSKLFETNDNPGFDPSRSERKRRRIFSNEDVLLSTVPFTDVRAAIDYFTSFLQLVPTCKSFEEGLISEVVLMLEGLLAAAKHMKSFVWTKTSDESVSASLAAQREVQNSHVAEIVGMMLRSMQFACAVACNNESSLSLKPNMTFGDLGAVLLRSSTVVAPAFVPSVSGSIFASEFQLSLAFDFELLAAFQPLCFSFAYITDPHLFLPVGDPRISPVFPPGLFGLSSRPLNASFASTNGMAFKNLRIQFPLFPGFTVTDATLIEYNVSGVQFLETSARRDSSDLSFSFDDTLLAEPYLLTGVAALRKNDVSPPYPAIVAPIFLIFLLIAMILSKVLDRPPKEEELKQSPKNFQKALQFAVGTKRLNRILQLLVFTAPFANLNPCSEFTRPRRTACGMHALFAILFFATVMQKSEPETHRYLEASISYGDVIGVGFGCSFVACLFTILLKIGFVVTDFGFKMIHLFIFPTPIDQEAMKAQGAALQHAGVPVKWDEPKTRPSFCLCFKTLAHVVWLTLAIVMTLYTIVFIVVTSGYETEHARDLNYQTLIFGILWYLLFWEPMRVLMIELLVRGYNERRTRKLPVYEEGINLEAATPAPVIPKQNESLMQDKATPGSGQRSLPGIDLLFPEDEEVSFGGQVIPIRRPPPPPRPNSESDDEDQEEEEEEEQEEEDSEESLEDLTVIARKEEDDQSSEASETPPPPPPLLPALQSMPGRPSLVPTADQMGLGALSPLSVWSQQQTPQRSASSDAFLL